MSLTTGMSISAALEGALPAMPAIFIYASIAVVIFMALRAVSEQGVMVYAPSGVFFYGDRLKVARIDAAWVTAEMVQVKAIRDFPDMHFVGNSMSPNPFTIHGKLTISNAQGSAPKPTTRKRLRGCVLRQARFNYGSILLCSQSILLRSFWSGLRRCFEHLAARFHFTPNPVEIRLFS